MNHLTITGYLGADPELSYVAATGRPVVNVRVADTPRSLNRETGQWENGTSLWLRASAWGPLAENIANSVRKGDRVTLTGRLTQHDYVNRNGEQRHRIELAIEDFAVSLTHNTVDIHRTPKREDAGSSITSNTGNASNGFNAGNSASAGNSSNSGNGGITSVTGNSGIAGNSGYGGVADGWPGDRGEEDPWGPVAVPGGGA